MDQHPPHYEHLDPSALYELLRVHRLNLEILTVQAAKFTSLHQPPYLHHNLQETSPALDGLTAEFRRRNLNPDAPPAGTRLVRRPAIMAPRLPDGFVERPTELEHLLSTILDSTRTQPVAITTAVQGAGGFGKTTLAAAICHTPAVINAFPDGILWVTLGETPSLVNTLIKLCEALTGERTTFVDEEQGAITLMALLQDRRCLIILDDVWEHHHLRPFLRGTTRCTWLITTRIARVAAAAQPVLVDEMTAAESVQLLTNRLSTPPADLGPFRSLAHRLGEWPLLLELAGAALRQRLVRGDTLEGALTHINAALDEEGITTLNQRHASERNQSLTITMQASLSLLDAHEQIDYTALAVFPEDVAIPLETLERLWGLTPFKTEQRCEILHDLALLKFDVHMRAIRIHDVVRAFLVEQVGATLPMLHGQFLDGYLQQTWADLPQTEPYLWRHVAYHLLGAHRSAKLLETVQDLRYVATKTFLVGTALVEHDFLAAARTHPDDQVLALLTRTFIQIGHLLSRCTSLPDVAATLVSRLQHRTALHPLLTTLVTHLQQPYLVPWQPLPDTPHHALVRTITGHASRVNGCAISADGTIIVSASDDATVKVWDAHTGAERATLTGHTRWVTDCAISVDGTTIVSASGDATLKVWDAHIGAERTTLTGHTAEVNGCVISADGSIIVSASNDRTLKVWDAHTGAERATLSGHSKWVTACAISADGTTIVSASGDHTVKVWDAYTGAERVTLIGHIARVYDCAISADGTTIISASDDTTLKIWDAHTGAERATLSGHTAEVNGCAISADGTIIVSASSDLILTVWDATTGAERATLTGHTRWVTACAISADGTIIVSASDDATVKVWDAHTGAERATLTGHTKWVTACAISADGQTIVSASDDYTVKVWDAHTSTERATLTGHTKWVTACAISADGRIIVSASQDGTLKVWDAEAGTERTTLTGHTAWVRGCAISVDGTIIVSASGDGTLKLWDAYTGAERATLTGHTAEVNGCAISADGTIIVSASGDSTLKVWDAHIGAERATLSGHTAEVIVGEISPNGVTIVSVSWDHTLKVWDATTGAERITFHADGRLYSCAWHPDGEHFIVAGHKGLYFLRLVQ